MKKTIFLFAMALGSTFPALAVTENSRQQILVRSLPAVSLLNTSSRSCRQQIVGDPSGPDDTPPVSALLRRFSFSWTGNQPLSLMWVRFRFEAPQIAGGRYDTLIAGSALSFLFPNAALIPPSASPIESSPHCFLTIGGIPVVNKSVSFTGQGTITIYGTSPKDGQDLAVTGEIAFPFRFYGAA